MGHGWEQHIELPTDSLYALCCSLEMVEERAATNTK